MAAKLQQQEKVVIKLVQAQHAEAENQDKKVLRVSKPVATAKICCGHKAVAGTVSQDASFIGHPQSTTDMVSRKGQMDKQRDSKTDRRAGRHA